MTTAYHKQIENGLLALGNEWKNQKRIRNFYRGSTRPLSLIDPYSKLVLNYQPDVYFILRNNKKLIFEVLDSEGRKQDKIIADVIRSFLVENVEALIFIHYGPESVVTTVFEALKTIYKGLVDKGVSQSELPNERKTGPYLIKVKEARDTQKLATKLAQYAKEAKW